MLHTFFIRRTTALHRNQIKKTSRLQKLVLFGATFDPEQFALISPSREPNPYIFIDKT